MNHDASTPDPNVRLDQGGWISGPCLPVPGDMGFHITYAEDEQFPGDFWCDLRDDDGRVWVSGSGVSKEAARKALSRRIAAMHVAAQP